MSPVSAAWTHPRTFRRVVGSLFEALNPYLFNPITAGRAWIHGEHTQRIGPAEARFQTDSLLLTFSLFHTFRKEGAILHDVVESLGPDDVFYDVGANLGVYTCLAGDVLIDGKIVAFEPHPANVTQLERNVELNDLDASVLEIALSDTSGEADLVVDQPWFSNQRYGLAKDARRETIRVEMTTGDELVERKEIPEATAVKIDVEGAETGVIDGLAATLDHERCRLLYCEVHPDLIERSGASPDTIERRLRDFGFDVEEAHSTPAETYLKGTKP